MSINSSWKVRLLQGWATITTMICCFLLYNQHNHSIERNALRQRLDSMELSYALCQQQLLTQTSDCNRNSYNPRSSSSQSINSNCLNNDNGIECNENRNYMESISHFQPKIDDINENYHSFDDINAQKDEEVRAANKMFQSLFSDQQQPFINQNQKKKTKENIIDKKQSKVINNDSFDSKLENSNENEKEKGKNDAIKQNFNIKKTILEEKKTQNIIKTIPVNHTQQKPQSNHYDENELIVMKNNNEKKIEESPQVEKEVEKDDFEMKKKQKNALPLHINTLSNNINSVVTSVSTTTTTVKKTRKIKTLPKISSINDEKDKNIIKSSSSSSPPTSFSKSDDDDVDEEKDEEVKEVDSSKNSKKETMEEMRHAAAQRRAAKRAASTKQRTIENEDEEEDEEGEDEFINHQKKLKRNHQVNSHLFDVDFNEEEEEDEDDEENDENREINLPKRKESSLVKDFSTATFEDALDNYDFIFVGFHAPWCNHCRRLLVELDETADLIAKQSNSITVGAVDCMQHRNLCSEIDSVPKLWLFRNRNAILKGASSMHRFIEYVGPRKGMDMANWVLTTSSILTALQKETYHGQYHGSASSSASSSSSSWAREYNGNDEKKNANNNEKGNGVSEKKSNSKSRSHPPHIVMKMNGDGVNIDSFASLPQGVSRGLLAGSSPTIAERREILSTEPAKEVNVCFWNLCEEEIGLHWLNRDIMDNGETNSPALTQVRLIDPSEEVEMLTYTGHTFFIVSNGGHGQRLLRFTILPNIERYVAMFCSDILEDISENQ